MITHFIAHRGTLPENTVEAFQKCVRHNVSIECDIRKSKDGLAVVIHDESLLRTSRVDTLASELDADELSSKYAIPLLSDVILTVRQGSCELFLEIKENDDHLVENIVSMITRNEMEDRCSIISFHPQVIRMVKQLSNKIRTGYVQGRITDTSDEKFDMLWLKYTLISRDIVLSNIEKGVRVFAWTVNDAKDIETLISMGVQGIVSDSFDLILSSQFV